MRFQQEKAPRTVLPYSVMNDRAIMWKNTTVVIWEFALNVNCSYSWKASGGLLLDTSCVLSVSCGQKEQRRGATLKVLSCMTDGCQGFEQDQLWSLGTKAACSVAQSTQKEAEKAEVSMTLRCFQKVKSNFAKSKLCNVSERVLMMFSWKAALFKN